MLYYVYIMLYDVGIDLLYRTRAALCSFIVFCAGDCPFKSEPIPTSADAYEEVTALMLAINRLAGVAPDVDLGECTLHLPLQKKQTRQNPLWL